MTGSVPVTTLIVAGATSRKQTNCTNCAVKERESIRSLALFENRSFSCIRVPQVGAESGVCRQYLIQQSGDKGQQID